MARSPSAAARSATTAASAPAAACRGSDIRGPDRRGHPPAASCATEVRRLPGLLSAGHEHLRPGRAAAAAVRSRRLAHPQVVGLAIGTRPDCVPDDVLDLLQRARRHAPTCRVEYGMQTIHDRSLDWMNRGHHHDAMLDAVERSRGRGFEICAHVILGLPGESHDDMLATAREVGPARARRREDSQSVRRQEHAAGRPGRARRSAR